MKTAEANIFEPKHEERVGVGGFKMFDLSKAADRKSVEGLRREGKILEVTDSYSGQLQEWFAVQYPDLYYSTNFNEQAAVFKEGLRKKKPFERQGKWVFYPWLTKIVHILDEDPFLLVRTSRNQNLITKEEQKLFYNTKVGVAGLSVGNSIVLSLVLQGGAGNLKLVDFDKMELSNLNRIRAGVPDLGLSKVEMTAREVLTVNPYAQVKQYDNGLSRDNISEFMEGLDLVVDEIDDFPTKVLIREKAKELKIPVITAIDNSDGSVLEIERYDVNDKIEPFHGALDKISYEEAKKMSKADIGKLIAAQVGFQNITARMQESFSLIGRELISWPQLAGAAMLNGVLVSYCVRKIATGEALRDRIVISLDDIILRNALTKQQKEERTEESRKLFL